jgi:hypothetical protein
MVSHFRNTESSYFGFKAGLGVIVSAADKHEVGLMLIRQLNKSRYTASDVIQAEFDKHEITFNTWEICLSYTFGKGFK